MTSARWFAATLLALQLVACAAFADFIKLPATLPRARTAVVVDMTWEDSRDPALSNELGLRVVNGEEEQRRTAQALQGLAATYGRPFRQELGRTALAIFRDAGAPDLGFDDKILRDASDFPVYDRERLGSFIREARDYRKLAEDGFTHVFVIGFTGTLDLTTPDAPLIAYLGYRGRWLDIQPGRLAYDDDARLVWRFWINQLPAQWTSTGGRWTVEYTVRDCLNVLFIDAGGRPLDRRSVLFGERPVLIDVLRAGAAWSARHAAEFLVRPGTGLEFREETTAAELLARKTAPRGS